MTFGENLKQAREKQGMTQQALADMLHVTRQAVSRWENEARCPDIYTAKRIVEALGVSLDEMMVCEEGAGADMRADTFPAGEIYDEGANNREAYAPPGNGMLTGSRSLLLTLYIVAAILYLILSGMTALGLILELFSTKLTLSLLLSQVHLNMVSIGNFLCYFINFVLMGIGICFCAAGSLRPRRAGALMGLHYVAYFISWAVLTVFFLERDADFPAGYVLSAVVTMVLPCVLTIWYFCSERRIPFIVLLLPAVVLLPGIVQNICTMVRIGVGFAGTVTAAVQMLPRLLVQVLIVYQGYLKERMYRRFGTL